MLLARLPQRRSQASRGFSWQRDTDRCIAPKAAQKACLPAAQPTHRKKKALLLMIPWNT